MTSLALACFFLTSIAGVSGATSEAVPTAPIADPWALVRFLEGNWIGVASGEPGIGTVHRSYQFILDDRFLHERNVSAYAPKQPKAPGEVHEHWSFFSYDKRRQTLVLRQFHQEGFVNQYVLVGKDSRPGRLVFMSESFENLDPRWQARELYDVVSTDEFIETFEIAVRGEDFKVYSRNTFKRTTSR